MRQKMNYQLMLYPKHQVNIQFNEWSRGFKFYINWRFKVGKTCFLTRYFKNQFNETFLSTIGIDKELNMLK